MFKSIIRLLSFFAKEINEVRRQPRLILSLLFGPFLILLLFGMGYQGETPNLRTALVLPQQGLGMVDIEQLKGAISANFTLVSTGSDLNGAMADLRADAVDVVEVLPADVQQRVLRGEQSAVEFTYNEVNPLNEQWIQYLSYAQVNEMNRTMLLKMTSDMQKEAGTARELLTRVRSQLDALHPGFSAANQAELQRSVRQLRGATMLFAADPLLASSSGEPAKNQQQLAQLRDDLDVLDRAISDGTLDRERERINDTRQRIAELERSAVIVSELPPQVIVSPLQPKWNNLYGLSLNFMTFYEPSVLALILQHIAVTLGALSLVRERLLGAIELFRVAPVSMVEVLLGKYLGYTLFIGIIAAVLMGLMLALGIPFLGSIALFAGLVTLLTVASLGIGFLISVWSTSDSQAVQLSMLVLLLSIFFSGFFLPLENFWAPVRVVGYVLPLTHGIAGLQAIMLRGSMPGDLTWLALGIIAGVTFVIVAYLAQQRLRQI